MIRREVRRIWSQGDLLTRLIFFHVLVFAGVKTLQLLGRLGMGPTEAERWMATSWKWEILRSQPWSVFTHVFLHSDVWHLVFNMLMLWWTGRMFIQELGTRRMLAVFLAGGWVGWLFYAVMLNAFPGLRTGDYALGASAAVMAVFVAVATEVPDRKVAIVLLGPVALKYLALLYVLLDYFALGDGDNAGGNLAHLGGAAFGFFWARQWQSGRDITRGLERVLDVIFGWLPGGKMRVVGGSAVGTGRSRMGWRRSQKPQRAKSDEEFNLEKREQEAQLDAILDKIARHGYDRLSAAEKEFLFRQSNKR
ncbi:MAG: hypothetical protein RJA19_783 [Bacteroidota bacterium]|jgi:membrane associated rhomboid family serine protease